MTANRSELPWDTLRHKKGDIPWLALRTFADAAVNDADVVQGLFDLYTQSHAAALTKTCYGDLYVPAIFALAAPKLDDEQRRRIGAFLIDELVAAGRDDDDLGLEKLMASVGAMGPVILPDVLEAIDGEDNPHGAWLYLWDLTLLAAETDDADLRQRVIRASVELLERVERDEVESWEAMTAAWTLATLKCTEYTDLLQRLCNKTRGEHDGRDYEEALDLLRGTLAYTPPKQLWEQPVEKWLKAQWQTARDWFVQRQREFDEPLDQDLDTLDSLTYRFLLSPIGQSLPPEILASGRYLIDELIDLSIGVLDADPLDWDESTLRELLLDVVPRRIVANEPLLSKIAPIMEAFLVWLGSEGALDNAQALAAAVHSWSDEIVSAGMNPNNWGPTKAFTMRAVENGQDLSDPALRQRFVDEQFQGILDSGVLETEPQPMPDEPPIPIVETRRKVGRNDPCPCGSGRKYKKCCGSTSAKS